MTTSEHCKRSKNLINKLIRSIKYPLLIKKLYNNQNLIAVSEGVEQDLLNFGIKPKSICTIYNPNDIDFIRQQSKEYIADEQDYIIHVGSFTNQKRHNILINAYLKSGIKQKLLLLGDHEKKQGKIIKQLVADLDLNDRVIFKGFEQNPYPYIRGAKALILSSDYEGLSMVLIEALILQVPVVSTDCPHGPREILIDELAEFLSPVGDINALATNIRRMVKNPVKITDKYIDKFRAEKSATQYLSLCDNE